MKSKKFPESGTTRRAALGSFMDFIGQGLRALEHIILIPLFIWAWGDAMYGEWMTLFSMIAYLSISDLGMNRYVTNRMTQKFSKGDVSEYMRSFKSAFGLYSIITGFLFILLIIFAFSAPLFEWFDFSTSPENQVRVSIIILGAYMILGTIGSLVGGLYDSTGDFVRRRIIGNIKNFLLIGFVALSLFMGGSFISVAFWYLFLLIAVIFFTLWDIKRRHPEIKFSKSDIDWNLGKSFIVPGGLYLLITLSHMIQIQGSVLIISSVIGATAVAIFTVHRTLSNLIEKSLGIIRPSIRPEIAVDEERRKYSKLKLIYSLLLKLIILFSLIAVIFLYFTGGGILRIWTGGEIMLDHSLWVALLVSVPIYTIWRFSALFLVSTNNYNRYSIIRIISAVIGLGLAILLAKIWGVTGVVVGFLIPEILINLWWVPREATHLIRGRFKNFLLIFLVGLCLCVLLFTVGWPIDYFLSNPWVKMFILSLTVSGIGAAFTYYAWLNNQERKIIDKFLSQVFAKIKRTYNELNS